MSCNSHETRLYHFIHEILYWWYLGALGELYKISTVGSFKREISLTYKCHIVPSAAAANVELYIRF